MKLRYLAVSSIFALASAASAADPQLLKLVMPDAQVVSGIDVLRVKAAPFGQFFLSQLPVDSGFNEFVALTGFDPRRDIQEIVMASPANPQSKTALLLARGTFDSERILSLYRASGKTTETYRGVAILSGGRGGKAASGAAAFLDNSIVVAGDLNSVRGAIDRAGVSGGLDAALTNRISRASANQDAWVVSIAPISAFAQAIPERNVRGVLQGDLFKTIQESSGGVRFGETIEISGELTALTAQDAASLADVVKFFTNVAALNGTGGDAAQFAALLRNLTVNTEANAVKILISIPESQLESLIKVASRRGLEKTPRI